MQPLRTRRYDAMLSSRLVKGRRDHVTLRFSFFLYPFSREWLDGGARTESTKYKQEGGLSSATVGRRGRRWVEGGMRVSYWATPL
jgi:hypothetical protein